MLSLKLRAARLYFNLKNASLPRKVSAVLLLLTLTAALLLLYPGMSRLRLLASGNPAIYHNLSVLWNQDPLKIHVIDVGQGDATLIQYEGTTVLIDAGPPDASSKLIRYLKDLGVMRLDLLILTHPHDDHIGGGPALLDEFPIGQLFAAHDAADSSLQIKILETARKKQIPFAHPYRGMRVEVSILQMDCLHPLPKVYSNINNYSSVWSLRFKNQRFLFLADLENDEIPSLPLSPSDFVRAGHHGSVTSSSDSLLTLLQPQIFAISCGAGNPFGHPSREVLAMLDRARIPYLRTDRSGTAVFSTDGRSLRWVH